MIKKVVRFFDRLEDHVRGALSHYPIVYTFLGGVGIVLFWRGVWDAADWFSAWAGLGFGESAILSIISSVILLLMIGLFVSFFISDRIILTGIRQEKKFVEKAANELKVEENVLATAVIRLESIEQELKKLTQKIEEIKK
jgi:hypothetical protein